MGYQANEPFSSCISEACVHDLRECEVAGTRIEAMVLSIGK